VVARHPVLARVYDLVMAPSERFGGMSRVRERLVRDATGRVLEVGIGTGLLLPHYRAAAEVHGVDPDPLMLRRARRRAAAVPVPVRLVLGDARALPYRRDTFDVAVVGLAFCTIPTPSRALAELRRVVRPGGELRFLEHVRSPSPRVAAWQRRLAPAWRRVAGGCRLDQDTVAVVEAAGWRIVHLWRSGNGVMVSGRAV